MLKLDLNSPRLKSLLIVLLAIAVASFGFALYYSINKKAEPADQNAFAPKALEKSKPLTAEEIQEALGKKADETGETSAESISAGEIQEALRKKATDTQPATALTSEEIQTALDAKAD